MSIEASSIDDVLAAAHLPPESKPEVDLNEPEPEVDHGEPVSEGEPESVEEPTEESEEVDDYGNESPKQESKTYTEDEVNERINKAVRERLARLERNQPQQAQQPTQQQAKQAEAAGFEYDADSNQDWQAQLKSFIRQTNEEVQREQVQNEQTQREHHAQAEFEDKFHRGMAKFTDFRDVVSQQPVTDAMTIATRSMKDPAAFLYAASKRYGDELKRISTLEPYTQMVEIGRLEERMKKAKATSSAPRPLGNTREDAGIKEPEVRKETIEDLIAQNDKKRLQNMRNRRG